MLLNVNTPLVFCNAGRFRVFWIRSWLNWYKIVLYKYCFWSLQIDKNLYLMWCICFYFNLVTTFESSVFQISKKKIIKQSMVFFLWKIIVNVVHCIIHTVLSNYKFVNSLKPYGVFLTVVSMSDARENYVTCLSLWA